MSKIIKLLRGQCPECGELFEYPYEDRVNVVLFSNWKKYHRCGYKKKIILDDAGFKEAWVKVDLEKNQINISHL